MLSEIIRNSKKRWNWVGMFLILTGMAGFRTMVTKIIDGTVIDGDSYLSAHRQDQKSTLCD